MRSLGLPTVSALVVSLFAYAAAPALAIAFWRNALAVGVIAPVAIAGRRHQLADLFRPGDGRRAGLLSVLAGFALAGHFGTWVPSAKLTSVATATALVATQPVWAALIARLRGIPVPSATWLGVGLAVVGAALATGADVSVSARAVAGDMLALVGGAAGAIYTTFGERARVTTSTLAYTTVCYTVCAAVLCVVCLVGGASLHGYPPQAWLAIAALTAGPQLLGHSLLNYTLRRISATTISVLLLLEVPGSALLGWALVGQVPALRSLPGLVVLVCGVGIAVVGSARRGVAAPAARAVTARLGERRQPGPERVQRQRRVGGEQDEVGYLGAADGGWRGDQRHVPEDRRHRGRFGPGEVGARTVDEVHRVDACLTQHTMNLGHQLPGGEVPRHHEAAERVADDQVAAARRLAGQVDPRVAGDHARARAQRQPRAGERDQL